MQKILKRIFRRDSILIVLLIVAAILGTFGVPQSIGIPSDQIILALLGALALDTLVERLGYLDRIEERIIELRNTIKSPVSADNIFKVRGEMPPFLPRLQECKEMYILGKDIIELLYSFGEQIQQEALKGKGKKHFRFLIIDPTDTRLMEVIAASSYLRPDAKKREEVIRQSLTILNQIVENSPKDSVQVRLMNWVPTNSYSIVDPEKEYGQILVEPFGFKITSADRRHMVLSRKTDQQSFTFHLGQFEKMWANAIPWTNKSGL